MFSVGTHLVPRRTRGTSLNVKLNRIKLVKVSKMYGEGNSSRQQAEMVHGVALGSYYPSSYNYSTNTRTKGCSQPSMIHPKTCFNISPHAWRVASEEEVRRFTNTTPIIERSSFELVETGQPANRNIMTILSLEK